MTKHASVISALALSFTIGGCVLNTEPLGAPDAFTTAPEGTGPEGYLPKFTATAQLTQSQVFERSGNIGIGTPAPIYNLHVGANSSGRSSITAEATYENAYLNLKYTGDTATLVNKNDGTFRINHSGNSTDAHLVLTTSGNIGIGTTAPDAKLDVLGSVKSTIGLQDGSAIARARGFSSYMVMVSNNHDAGTNVRSAIYHVVLTAEGSAVAATNTVSAHNMNNIPPATFSVSGGYLLISSLPKGNNKAAVFEN